MAYPSIRIFGPYVGKVGFCAVSYDHIYGINALDALIILRIGWVII